MTVIDPYAAGSYLPKGGAELKVGMRVRVRINGECEAVPEKGSVQSEIGHRGHPEVLNEMLGVIQTTVNIGILAEQGHNVMVKLDEEYPYHDQNYRSHQFASVELLVIEDAGA